MGRSFRRNIVQYIRNIEILETTDRYITHINGGINDWLCLIDVLCGLLCKAHHLNTVSAQMSRNAETAEKIGIIENKLLMIRYEALNSDERHIKRELGKFENKLKECTTILNYCNTRNQMEAIKTKLLGIER